MPSELSDAQLVELSIHAANCMVTIADATVDDFPLMFVNNYFLTFTGYSEAEVLGKNCRFLQQRPDGDLDNDQPGLDIIRWGLHEGRFVQTVVRNYKKNGEMFWNEVFLSPVRNAEGQVVYFVGMQNDVTQRHEAEQIIKGLFSSSATMLGVVEQQGDRLEHVALNPAAAEFFGVEVDDLVGETLGDVGLGKDFLAIWDEAFREAFDTGRSSFPKHVEVRGGRYDLFIRISRIEADSNQPRYCYSMEDVTEITQSEGKRLLLESAITNAEEPVIVAANESDGSFRIESINPAMTELTGILPDELIGQPLSTLDIGEGQPSMHETLRGLGADRTVEGRCALRTARKETAVMNWSATPILATSSKVRYWILTLHETAERARLKEQILSLQGREQQRIASDLHDGLIQELAGLKMHCHLLEGYVPAEQRDVLDRIDEITQRLTDHAREIAHGLLPIPVEPEGLDKSLRTLATRTRGKAVDCVYESVGDIRLSDGDVAQHVYRIAFEAVSNASRHAAPSRIEIRVERNGNEGLLTVRDDGSGFQAEELDEATIGFGLRVMKYRAESMGGTFDVKSKPGEGTTVNCVFPFGKATVDGN